MPRKNSAERHAAVRGLDASMRPRPDAAEKPDRCSAASLITVCFNEAAARCRGKTGAWARVAQAIGRLQ